MLGLFLKQSVVNIGCSFLALVMHSHYVCVFTFPTIVPRVAASLVAFGLTPGRAVGFALHARYCKGCHRSS